MGMHVVDAMIEEYPMSVCAQIALRKARAAVKGTDGLDEFMEIANLCMRGFGVEPIRVTGKCDRYWGDTDLLYVNMGDTYIPTLIYDTRSGKFSFRPWGDVVEAHPKRFASEGGD